MTERRKTELDAGSRRASLTRDQIANLKAKLRERADPETGGYPRGLLSELAREYGVSRNYVSMIAGGKRRANIS